MNTMGPSASMRLTTKIQRFMTFEGIDGAGKTTHIHAVAEYLRQQGQTVVLTREPGGTPLGEQLRHLLLSVQKTAQPAPMHAETETLLMFAARREHLAAVIEPALARGDWVMSDRFSDASFAYQGGGRGVAEEKLLALEQWVHPTCQPCRTYLFDLPPAVAAQRIDTQRGERDRFEQEQASFHERVRQAYRQRAEADPKRFLVLDATQSIEVLKAQILADVAQCLAQWGRSQP